jgi:hypothetical protein
VQAQRNRLVHSNKLAHSLTTEGHTMIRHGIASFLITVTVVGGAAIGAPAQGLPTTGDCSRVDWQSVNAVDLNGDGLINCNSDMELGA